MNLDTLKDGIFHVWQPNCVDLLKGSESGVKEWKIGGYASTEALDRQGESVLQKGLDFSEFVQHGYYNDNHQQHTAAVVGVPETAEFHKSKGWHTSGYLLKDVKRAQEIFTLAKSLTGTQRKLGFSIEGKILERLGSKIVKALIRNVAITNSPVNTECTWDLMAKSWATDLEAKALSVGHARAPDSGGRILVPEDLEKDELKYVYYCPHCSKAFGTPVGIESHISKAHTEIQPVTSSQFESSAIVRRAAKSLTPEQAVDYLRRIRPDYSDEVCSRLVDFVQRTDIE